MSVRNAFETSAASVGLSITKPSSVLRCIERGSKLNEPTNSRWPSTAKVLACSIEALERRTRPSLPPPLPEPLLRRLRLGPFPSDPSRHRIYKRRPPALHSHSRPPPTP